MKKSKITNNVIELSEAYTSFSNDVDFMKEHIDMIVLSDKLGQSKVALSATLQGRVMTSTANGNLGRSYGWINRELIASAQTLEHMNPYGGEERFWLGPEGGQYAIFFKPGSEFHLNNWQTPKLIDLEPYNVKSKSSAEVVFTKKASLVNYAGFQFDLYIERKIAILSKEELLKQLSIENLSESIKSVGYQSTNLLTNFGDKDWKKETGLLSIWLLGMYNAAASTKVVIPFNSGTEEELGKPVTDDYFGKVPSERLIVKDNVLFFSGDAKQRGKIGISPNRAKDILGSYDAETKVLTIVKFSIPNASMDYVNSLWEIQEDPYAGDVVNSYNDGPSELGEKQLGQFYELETSSPALALKSKETGTHIQLTAHFEGDEIYLDVIAQQLLGVSIEEIKSVFNKKIN